MQRFLWAAAGVICVGVMAYFYLTGGAAGTSSGADADPGAGAFAERVRETPHAPTSSSTVSTAPVVTPSRVADEPSETASPEDTAWEETARSFCRAFGAPSEQWADNLAPLVSDDMATTLRGVDVRRVTAAQCTGVQAQSAGLGIAIVVMTYDGAPNIYAQVEETLDGWRVTRYERAD